MTYRAIAPTRTLSATKISLVSTLLLVAPIAAQTQVRTFEVVTIRPSDPASVDSRIDLENGNHFIARKVTVQSLVKVAYHLTFNGDNQIVCEVPWFASQDFDVDAKLDEATLREMVNLDSDARFNSVREMLQSTLNERFSLSLHHETKENKVQSLVAMKTGVRLRPATAGAESWTGIKLIAPGRLEGREASMDSLANALAKEPEVGGRLVTNGTGLKDKYNFVLTWSPEALNGGSQSGSDANLFVALREQLGLRLEVVKAPTDTLVIDRVEMPTPN